jgi:tRNA A37 N6-isopentenylltransferase MiaA
MSKLPERTLPIVCGGTHYFIQHFLFPPSDLSFDRPDPPTESQGSKRWNPPHPRPETPNDLDPELERLLETFWTDTPVWPTNPNAIDFDENEAGPSRHVLGSETDDQLLALHQLLAAVDSKEAGRWHWRDGRKVRRGLERWWETNGSQEQHRSSETEAKGRKARYVFWSRGVEVSC